MIAAVLERRRESREHAITDHLDNLSSDVEHPARTVIAAYKAWMRQLLAQLAEADGLPDPDWWGSALMLLIDGANARVITTGDTTAIVHARRTAAALIAAAPALPLTSKENL